jgi:hypothetical protein
LTDGTIVMELAMDGIRKHHADFYRGYLADDRSLIPLTTLLATGVAVWLLFYLVGTVGPAPRTHIGSRAARARDLVDLRVADPLT